MPTPEKLGPGAVLAFFVLWAVLAWYFVYATASLWWRRR